MCVCVCVCERERERERERVFSMTGVVATKHRVLGSTVLKTATRTCNCVVRPGG